MYTRKEMWADVVRLAEISTSVVSDSQRMLARAYRQSLCNAGGEDAVDSSVRVARQLEQDRGRIEDTLI